MWKKPKEACNYAVSVSRRGKDGKRMRLLREVRAQLVYVVCGNMCHESTLLLVSIEEML